jgi:hypothetical protein
VIIGGFVTLIFAYLYDNDMQPFFVLGYVLILGLFWDILYNLIQRFRWDRDWPPTFQLGAGIVEGVFIWGLIQLWPTLTTTPLPGLNPDLIFGRFLAHYTAVWLTTFLAAQSLLRIIYPRWRFRGGLWLFRWLLSNYEC